MASVTPTAPAGNRIVPNDRIIHADRWQGTLDSPSAAELDDTVILDPFGPDFTGYADEAPEFEPTDADWDDMARWCEWCDRNDEIARGERIDEASAEAAARYNI
jgi:hypothetical protein